MFRNDMLQDRTSENTQRTRWIFDCTLQFCNLSNIDKAAVRKGDVPKFWKMFCSKSNPVTNFDDFWVGQKWFEAGWNVCRYWDECKLSEKKNQTDRDIGIQKRKICTSKIEIFWAVHIWRRWILLSEYFTAIAMRRGSEVGISPRRSLQIVSIWFDELTKERANDEGLKTGRSRKGSRTMCWTLCARAGVVFSCQFRSAASTQ